MLGWGVICATQVGGRESKAPEKMPYKTAKTMIEGAEVIAFRQARTMPAEKAQKKVMLNLQDT
jgi:hypothetical protein